MLTRREHNLIVLFSSILIIFALVNFTNVETKAAEHNGRVENKNFHILRLDDRLDKIVDEKAVVSKIVEGFVFAEGPVWDRRSQRLLFSDVRDNKIYEIKDNVLNTFLDPVFKGEMPNGMRNVSANGLTFNADGDLVIAEHGYRRISSISVNGKKSILASKKDGRRFNSPNDLVFDSRGNLYFTDPPYGLEGYDSSKIKEIPYNGIYKLTSEGDVFLLDSQLTRPNGVALSPDEKILEFVGEYKPLEAVTENSRFLSTILFNDIVNSTQLQFEVGDSQWKEKIMEFNRLCKEQIASCDGSFVKSMGDGILATFDGPSRAIKCACRINEGVRSLGLVVRSELHVGEIEKIEGDISGINVNAAARIQAVAKGGQVLVSEVLKSLVFGSGIEFGDSGSYRFKGFDTKWKLFQVNMGKV